MYSPLDLGFPAIFLGGRNANPLTGVELRMPAEATSRRSRVLPGGVPARVGPRAAGAG